MSALVFLLLAITHLTHARRDQTSWDHRTHSVGPVWRRLHRRDVRWSARWKDQRIEAHRSCIHDLRHADGVAMVDHLPLDAGGSPAIDGGQHGPGHPRIISPNDSFTSFRDRSDLVGDLSSQSVHAVCSACDMARGNRDRGLLGSFPQGPVARARRSFTSSHTFAMTCGSRATWAASRMLVERRDDFEPAQGICTVSQRQTQATEGRPCECEPFRVHLRG